MKYFVDADGAYLGGYDGAAPPFGAVEVPHAPGDALQRWNGQGFDPPPVETPPPSLEEMVHALVEKELGNPAPLAAVKLKYQDAKAEASDG